MVSNLNHFLRGFRGLVVQPLASDVHGVSSSLGRDLTLNRTGSGPVDNQKYHHPLESG